MKTDDWSVVILALDTSSAGGSAAVIRVDGDHTVVIERAGDETRTHGERLPMELMAVLRDAGAAFRDVERFAVAVGPGSFTGLRVGIATMQGLALARALPVTPVSTFEALAWHARGTSGATAGAIATWVDAHRGEGFATLFASDGRTVLAPAPSRPPTPTSTPLSGSQPRPSPTPGRAKPSSGSSGIPTSPRSTCCVTIRGRSSRSASAG